MKHMMNDMVKSLMDGLKDARMYYDYAKEAKEAGYTDMATYFIMRAKTRMTMMNEDYHKLNELIKKMEVEKGVTFQEGKWDCLHTHIMEEKEQLDYLISSFK